MIVEQIIVLFLVRHQGGDPFQQEIEVIGPGFAVRGEGNSARRTAKRRPDAVTASTTSLRPPRENPVTCPIPESKITTPAALSSSARWLRAYAARPDQPLLFSGKQNEADRSLWLYAGRP